MATPAGPNRPRRFDLSMSRRTRRPIKVSQDWDKSDGSEQRMSLQELLSGGAAGRESARVDADEGGGVTAQISVLEGEEKKTMLPAAEITSGGKHGELSSEKKKNNNKLAIVAKPGGASSGMVSRYVKVVLNNFIQARSAAKKKKNELKLLK